jgi:hypothetical protein
MAAGTTDKVKGAVKDGAGKLTGDKRTEAPDDLGAGTERQSPCPWRERHGCPSALNISVF